MTITVQFRGVLMLERERGRSHLKRVLVPLAEPGVVPRDATAATPIVHADGTVATPHYSGIVVFDRATGQPVARVEPLRGEVRLVATTGNDTPRFDKPGSLPSLSRVTNRNGGHAADLEVEPDATLGSYIAATVVATGGEMTPIPNGDSAHQWSFTEAFRPGHGQNKRLALVFGWVAEAASVRIVPEPDPATCSGLLKDGKGTMTFDATRHVVFIYNADVPNPSLPYLERTDAAALGNLAMDVDFKWLYQLLRPADGKGLVNWYRNGNWAAVGEPPHLPAPRGPQWLEMTTGKSAKAEATNEEPTPAREGMKVEEYPSVSTCFISSWP